MKRWTDQEWQRAKTMLDQGIDRHVIARTIGRAIGCLKEKIRWESMSEDQRAARLTRIREKRRAETASIRERLNREKQPPKRQISSGPQVCPKALSDRDLRKGMAPRDLTAEFCGDPLPGYSALERRT